MIEEKCYTLRVFCDEGRRTHVSQVIAGLFCCGASPTDSTGDHIAARFTWRGEAVVGLVMELSRRMPLERFDLSMDPLQERVAPARYVMLDGRIVDRPTAVAEVDPELPLWKPEELQVVQFADGSVDLPATVIVNLSRVYKKYLDDAFEPLPWKHEIALGDLVVQTAALESLLTSEESLEVAPRRREHKRKGDELLARLKAAEVLNEATTRLADPTVAPLMEEEDRQALERLSRLASTDVTSPPFCWYVRG